MQGRASWPCPQRRTRQARSPISTNAFLHQRHQDLDSFGRNHPGAGVDARPGEAVLLGPHALSRRQEALRITLLYGHLTTSGVSAITQIWNAASAILASRSGSTCSHASANLPMSLDQHADCGWTRTPCRGKDRQGAPAPGAVVADRMACGGRRATQILSFESARGYRPERFGVAGTHALAHRARLPRSQTGVGGRSL